MRRLFLFAIAVALPGFAAASTPSDFQRLDTRSAASCVKAAGLKAGKAGAVVRFSDRSGMDARIVTGRWPQPHMKNAQARMLCLYHRATGRVEVQELAL